MLFYRFENLYLSIIIEGTEAGSKRKARDLDGVWLYLIYLIFHYGNDILDVKYFNVRSAYEF
jgi:hypothetical protein